MVTTRQSNKKSHHVSEGAQNLPSNIDRLSDLPDGIICHILSFLPIKLSVSTSILSKRWKSLWAHVPNLEVDTENHHSGTSFSSFINRVRLLRKEQSIDTFRIHYEYLDSGEYELETWITTAFECNVQNLSLELDFADRLPQCLFTCKTLVNLHLYCCAGIPSTGAISFPCLKTLLICSFELETDEALPRLLSGCPVLKEFAVERIVDQDLGCCYISSPTIKSLSISFPVDESGYDDYYCPVKINAPTLEHIGVFDCSYDHLSFSSPMTSLVQADIWFHDYPLEVDYYFYSSCVLNFIDSLCKVKRLQLSSHKEFPDFGVAGRYVRFDNLIKLELTADWCFITKFLESADNLKILIIHKVKENLRNWTEPRENRCACLLFSLRTIKIDQFECTEEELNMVEYFLRNARVLKRMTIYSQHDGISLEAKSNAFKRISLFHRCSTKCEVAVV